MQFGNFASANRLSIDSTLPKLGFKINVLIVKTIFDIFSQFLLEQRHSHSCKLIYYNVSPNYCWLTAGNARCWFDLEVEMGNNPKIKEMKALGDSSQCIVGRKLLHIKLLQDIINGGCPHITHKTLMNSINRLDFLLFLHIWGYIDAKQN